MTYFVSHIAVADPTGSLRSFKIVPDDFVIHKDVMYAANAGAIGGHMGLFPIQDRAIPNLDTKKYPGLCED